LHHYLLFFVLQQKFAIFAEKNMSMNIHSIPAFKECYIMQRKDIKRFAATLADGFSQYCMFKHVCYGTYDHDLMRLFWEVSLTLLPDNAICIADSEAVNSVLAYIPPKSKEPSLLDYMKAGGVKMFFKFGIRRIFRLTRFNIEIEQVVKRYRAANDGYLMAFATRLNKQGQHYGKPLITTLMNHLDASGESCYLETLEANNVALYQHFSFQLEGQTASKMGNITLYAMRRPGNPTF
jgi:ribosomal protein S18 acetylase RimI-like enzyme